MSQNCHRHLKILYFETCIKGRSSHQRCSIRKSVLKNFTKFTGKQLCWNLFSNKVAGSACNVIKKETLPLVFSSEFCEIFKNTFFTEHLQTTASKLTEYFHITQKVHCLKSVQIRDFSGPYFAVFGLNAEIYGLNLGIQSEYRKVRTIKNSVFGHFSHTGTLIVEETAVVTLTPRLSDDFYVRGKI